MHGPMTREEARAAFVSRERDAVVDWESRDFSFKIPVGCPQIEYRCSCGAVFRGGRAAGQVFDHVMNDCGG